MQCYCQPWQRVNVPSKEPPVKLRPQQSTTMTDYEPDTVPGQLPDSKIMQSAKKYKIFETSTMEEHLAPTIAINLPITKEGGLPPKQEVPVKHDTSKTDWSLVPMESVEEIAKVLEFGAKKYSANNWRTGKGFNYTRVLNSLRRHIYAWSKGEDLDPESGLNHLAHAGCNVLFLLYYVQHKDRFNNDDRFKE